MGMVSIVIRANRGIVECEAASAVVKDLGIVIDDL
jgi:hypothetical protein